MSVDGQNRLQRPRVLVVEDVSAIRRLIEVCLRPIGPDLTMAADGTIGLQSAVDDPPEMILLDIGLPGLDGWQVLKGLREDRKSVVKGKSVDLGGRRSIKKKTKDKKQNLDAGLTRFSHLFLIS